MRAGAVALSASQPSIVAALQRIASARPQAAAAAEPDQGPHAARNAEDNSPGTVCVNVAEAQSVCCGMAVSRIQYCEQIMTCPC